MNVKLVESLAQIIQSLTRQEQALLEEKIKIKVDKDTNVEAVGMVQERPSHKTASPQERAKAFREWAQSHPRDTPLLSDEAISRESIYGENC